MSDKFQPLSVEQLAAWVFAELQTQNSIFGIPRELFFVPPASGPLETAAYGRRMETPFGVAAGPHSQMAQNIIAAWLCGARFIELKTVQTLDEIEVSKPCIDMQDEGYNVEWSQELKVRQSLDEYARAWVIIHALHRRLGFPGDEPGLVFNASVGYNLEGILRPNMQEYLRSLGDASEFTRPYVDTVSKLCPEVRDVRVPDRISDNVTLSTMHGCPPDEIEKIAAYLVRERGFHTNVKLNPTLLGPERLRGILNDRLGYRDVVVPDAAFGHDLKYADAAPMLKRLQTEARTKGVEFGVKLSNTLEVENFRDAFAKKEKMMYLSGRALHAVTVNLAAKLSAEFAGALPMSFSAGADAFNVAELLAAGMKTVTVCSDILKPGGYLRMVQYIDRASAAIRAAGARNVDAFAKDAAARLRAYAEAVLDDPRYRKDRFDTSRTKTTRPLGLFDCIKAPCTDECPVEQKVPQYMNAVREGRFDEAIELTREDNPLPCILGRACNHLCENLCIRTHYDEPLAIREMKRFIMSRETSPHFRTKTPARAVRVAVIGGGPCGLSIAYFLGQAGYAVTVFEARAYVGGMVSGTIPAYRAAQAAIDQDLAVLRDLGVEIRCSQEAGRDFTLPGLRKEGFRYIAIATGAQRGKRLGVEGEDAAGVLDALDFLRSVKEHRPLPLGSTVGVIGGGDVAMDCARTARRLAKGTVTILYRRTIGEMPADREEIEGVLEEGIGIVELAKPLRVKTEAGRVAGLECLRMRLGEKDASGRRRPVEIPGSEYVIPVDTLIVAISQEPALDFLGDEPFARTQQGYLQVDPATFETSIPGVYAGGDIALDGPESIVRALGDGRRIAESIRAKEERFARAEDRSLPDANRIDLIRRRATRAYRVAIPHLPVERRGGFDEVVLTLSEATAREEAARCLDCHRFCSTCVSVCPNRAFMTYRVEPADWNLPELSARGGKLVEGAARNFRAVQSLQVAVLTDFCNECGNCATFCPTAGRPYADKPRLYLSRKEFEAQSDNAFMASRVDGLWSLQGRFGGATHELVLNADLVYSGPKVHARLDPATLRVREAVPTTACRDGDAISLVPCAVMVVLLRGIRDSLSHLPV